MSDAPFSYDLPRLRAALAGVELDFLEETPSTNSWALDRIRSGTLRPPTLVLAGRQTAGRGRGRNAWWSGPGSAALSLAIDPRMHGLRIESWPRMSLAAALAVCETVEATATELNCGLKWPNDVFVREKKLAGILVETVAPRDEPRLVIGIGVNVNNTLAEAPEDVRWRAISLTDAAARTFDPTSFVGELVARLTAHAERLGQGDADQAAAWRSRSILDGRTVCIEQGSRRIAGRCQGIDAEGALLLLTERGQERIISGSVSSVEGLDAGAP